MDAEFYKQMQGNEDSDFAGLRWGQEAKDRAAAWREQVASSPYGESWWEGICIQAHSIQDWENQKFQQTVGF